MCIGCVLFLVGAMSKERHFYRTIDDAELDAESRLAKAKERAVNPAEVYDAFDSDAAIGWDSGFWHLLTAFCNSVDANETEESAALKAHFFRVLGVDERDSADDWEYQAGKRGMVAFCVIAAVIVANLVFWWAA